MTTNEKSKLSNSCKIPESELFRKVRPISEFAKDLEPINIQEEIAKLSSKATKSETKKEGLTTWDKLFIWSQFFKS
jgi:hypothetical protein